MPWNWAAGDGKQTALGTECACNKQRGKFGCRISVVSWEDTSPTGKEEGKKISIGGLWKSVKPNSQHPFRDFRAIIFIGKSTEAIASVAWRWSWEKWRRGWCLSIPHCWRQRASLLHPWQKGELLLQCCGWGRRNAFLFPLPDRYLPPYVKPGNCFNGPGAVLAVIFIMLMLCGHPW